MGDIFSFERFGKLLRIQFREQIVSLVVLFVSYFAALGGANLLLFNVATSNEGRLFGTVVIIFIFLSVAVFVTTLRAGRSCREYFDRSRASAMLMLPSSRLEQFMVPFVLNVILLPALMLIGFYLIEYTMFFRTFDAMVGEFADARAIIEQQQQYMMAREALGSTLSSVPMWLMLFASHAYFFLGAMFFKSVPYLKSNLVLLGIFILIAIASSSDAVQELLSNSISIENMLEESGAKEYIVPGFFLALFGGLSWLKFKRFTLP